MRTAALALVFLAAGTPAGAGASWTAQLSGGLVQNAPTPLRIEQEGEADLRVTARYDTRPLESPLYYAARLGRWAGGRAWEVELVHSKLHLSDPPPEVGRFSVSHGYNLLLVNRAWEGRWAIGRLGAGVVVTHPESEVRGRSLDQGRGAFGQGYYLSGASAQAAVEKRLHLGERLFAAVEGKVTGAWARVPVEGGWAEVPNVALHGLFGLGWRF